MEALAGMPLPLAREHLCCIRPFVPQVLAAVSDVHRAPADAGGLPVDQAGDNPSMPEHVARMEVAMNERAVLIEDRAVKDLDRPFPHVGFRHPVRQLAPARPRVCSVIG